MSTAQSIAGGFDDPVLGAQAGFQAIMNALARPGTIHSLVSDIAAPAPLNTASGVTALTLFDADTAVYLQGDYGAARQWLSFQTDAQLVEEMKTAMFVFLADGWPILTPADLSLGTQEYPDRSTTLIVQVDDFALSPGWELSGPGIEGSTDFQPLGLPDTFLDFWNGNSALFPRGVDVIFTAGTRLAAVPRTTSIRMNGSA